MLRPGDTTSRVPILSQLKSSWIILPTNFRGALSQGAGGVQARGTALISACAPPAGKGPLQSPVGHQMSAPSAAIDVDAMPDVQVCARTPKFAADSARDHGRDRQGPWTPG